MSKGIISKSKLSTDDVAGLRRAMEADAKKQKEKT
jgi:hypothetical protein